MPTLFPPVFATPRLRSVKETLTGAGHTLRIVDLYEENFNPVLTRADREAYLDNTEYLKAQVPEHIDNLHWADGLVFVFPTWFFGPPSILKGWFERVWLPGVTFNIATEKGQKTSSCMKHIKRLAVITSSGSPMWWMFLVGNPCKRFFTRAMRATFDWRCKTTWLQLYEMNVIDDRKRHIFLQKIKHKMERL